MRWAQRGGSIPEPRQEIRVQPTDLIEETLERYAVRIVAFAPLEPRPFHNQLFAVVYEEESS